MRQGANQLVLVLILVGLVRAQDKLPSFEDYPATRRFTGTPAGPRIETAQQRMYRTRIREGVAKGWGVFRDGKPQDRPGPNFAGKMIVIDWGCGVPCLMTAVVDAESGTVYNLPISYDGVGGRDFTRPFLNIGYTMPQVADVDFRENSRLMVIKATPKDQPKSWTYYFLWQNNRWTLLRRIPLTAEDQ